MTSVMVMVMVTRLLGRLRSDPLSLSSFLVRLSPGMTITPTAVFYGAVAAGQLLAILPVHAVHDCVLRGDGGHAEAQELADSEGHGERCCQPQSVPGRQVKLD